MFAKEIRNEKLYFLCSACERKERITERKELRFYPRAEDIYDYCMITLAQFNRVLPTNLFILSNGGFYFSLITHESTALTHYFYSVYRQLCGFTTCVSFFHKKAP